MMARVYSYDGMIPAIDPAAFVHPEAVVIGDVIIGPMVYVGPGAVLRGDFGRIMLKAGGNMQETASPTCRAEALALRWVRRVELVFAGIAKQVAAFQIFALLAIELHQEIPFAGHGHLLVIGDAAVDGLRHL